MSDPEITIVIPAWGSYAGEPLREALASIRVQDVPARVILVDNASEEPITPIAEVELIRASQRLTVGAARNLGLNRVSSPYVLFWDADDVMLPGTLRFLLEQMASDERLVAVAAGIVDDAGGTRHRWPPAWGAKLARAPTLFAFAHSVWSLYPSTGATLMRTQAVVEAGGYAAAERAVSAEDWVLGVSLAHRGRIGLHERPGRVYRRLGTSLLKDHRRPSNQLDHAAEIRHRLRADSGLPVWARWSAIPLKALHPAVLLGLAPLARRIRAALPRRGRNSR